MPDNLVASDTGGRIVRIVTPVGCRVEPGDAIMGGDGGVVDVTLEAPVAGRVKTLFLAVDEMLPEAAMVAVIES